MGWTSGVRRMSRRVLAVFAVIGLVSGTLALSPGPAVAAGPKVAVYDSAIFASWGTEVVTKLNATGLFSQVDNLSPLAQGLDPTPTLATLQQYAAVLVFSDDAFNDATALGDVLADYVDGGGHVVVGTFGFHTLVGLAGRIVTGGYLPLTLGAQTQFTQMFLVADVPGDPLLAGVSSFDGGTSSYHNTSSLASGATLVAHWTDGYPLVAYKGNVVALNFYPPSSDSRSDFWNTATDGVRLMTNALTFNGANLTDLSPANVWIGLKNSDDVGTNFDLLAEVFKDKELIGSGELDNVPGGGSGFSHAVNRSITLALGAPTSFASGDTLSIRLSVRISAAGHRSGTARLWFNDAQANTSFDAKINGVDTNYYLRNGFILDTSPGPVTATSKKSIDVFVDRLVNGNAFKPFGTWTTP